MKRPVFLIIFAVLMLVSVLLGLNDTRISVADTGSPNNEVTTTISKASNSSSSASITITMTGILNE